APAPRPASCGTWATTTTWPWWSRCGRAEPGAARPAPQNATDDGHRRPGAVRVPEVTMTIIEDVRGLELLDSRGNPTVGAVVTLSSGVQGMAAVPSGASTGGPGAVALGDGGGRCLGKGVTRAVANVTERIGPEVLGLDALDQPAVDRAMLALDGSPNKAELGANAILAVSLAVARAAAETVGTSLYRYLGGSNAKVLP